MKQRILQLIICFIYFIFGGLFVILWQNRTTESQQLEQQVLNNRVAFIHGNFSSHDIFQIRQLILTKTKEEILSIKYSEVDKEIEVLTGFQRGPLDGGGTFFKIKKENHQWVIISQGPWAS